MTFYFLSDFSCFLFLLTLQGFEALLFLAGFLLCKLTSDALEFFLSFLLFDLRLESGFIFLLDRVKKYRESLITIW